MLTQQNLSKHTERHHQLNEKRDFVEEYLDSLDLSALKLASKVRTQSSPSKGQELSSAETSSQPILPQHQSQSQSQSQQQPQQQRHQQDKAKRRGTRSKLEQHSADEAPAAKQHSRKTQESKSTLIESTKRRDSLMTARQDETKSSKRRRQYVEAVELEVQNLDINESDSSKTALRKRKGRPVRASVKTRNLAPAKQARTRRSREDLHEKQPHNGQRSAISSRKPLKSRSENNNHISHDHRHARHHHRHQSHDERRDHHRNDLKELPTNRGNSGRSDSNKPRKILTQGSLIINQFTSPNVSKERITMAEKTGRPGIFRKGRASQRTTVLTGHEFSEQDFLNPPEIAGSRQLDDPTRNEVVTSAYFTPTQDTHMDHESTSDGNKGQNTAYSSSDSRSYSELPRQTSLLHRGLERRSHRHRLKEASLTGLSEKSHSKKSQSDKSLSEMFSFAELDDRQLWSSSVPESRVPIPATEAPGEEAVMIQQTVEPTQHADQTSYYPEAETTTPHCYEPQYFEPASAYDGLQHSLPGAQDPYRPSYYEHDPPCSMFYEPLQDPGMEMAVQWPIQGATPLPLLQQPSQPFVELPGDLDADTDAVDYHTPLYALGTESSAPSSQPRFRWRPHRLY